MSTHFTFFVISKRLLSFHSDSIIFLIIHKAGCCCFFFFFFTIITIWFVSKIILRLISSGWWCRKFGICNIAFHEEFFTHSLDHLKRFVSRLNSHLWSWANCEALAWLKQCLMQSILLIEVVADVGRLNTERIITVALSPILLRLAGVDFDCVHILRLFPRLYLTYLRWAGFLSISCFRHAWWVV